MTLILSCVIASAKGSGCDISGPFPHPKLGLAAVIFRKTADSHCVTLLEVYLSQCVRHPHFPLLFLLLYSFLRLTEEPDCNLSLQILNGPWTEWCQPDWPLEQTSERVWAPSKTSTGPEGITFIQAARGRKSPSSRKHGGNYVFTFGQRRESIQRSGKERAWQNSISSVGRWRKNESLKFVVPTWDTTEHSERQKNKGVWDWFTFFVIGLDGFCCCLMSLLGRRFCRTEMELLDGSVRQEYLILKGDRFRQKRLFYVDVKLN